MSINFNESSKQGAEKLLSEPKNNGEDPLEKSKRTGERTRFIHKPNPLVERSYQIFEYDFKRSDYEHAGDYILINKNEKPEVTEKKLINLMTLLNGKDDLIDISSLTTTRVLFTLVPEAQESDHTKIIFKDYDGSGVSKENAVFTIRKGVFDD